jgi:dihydroorotate dehydrogenase (NAD+) catalytic subunit
LESRLQPEEVSLEPTKVSNLYIPSHTAFYKNFMENYTRPLEFSTPLMNAAGSLGFYPDAHAPVDWMQFGAFVTNPISRQRRLPARPPRWLPFAGGALLHSGHPNPGFNEVLKKYAGRWARSPLPVIVHLLGGNSEELHSMLVRLEEVENVIAVEIGLPDTIESGEAVGVVESAIGELPVIVRLPITKAVELGELIQQAGASAVSLGPPRGALPGPDGENVQGRSYGPGVFPQALHAVDVLAQHGVPVIGGGGLYKLEQAEAMLAAGALAVQLDTVLWRGDWFVLGSDEGE